MDYFARSSTDIVSTPASAQLVREHAPLGVSEGNDWAECGCRQATLAIVPAAALLLAFALAVPFADGWIRGLLVLLGTAVSMFATKGFVIWRIRRRRGSASFG